MVNASCAGNPAAFTNIAVNVTHHRGHQRLEPTSASW